MVSGQQKIPPHNIEAEESLIGAILIDQDAIAKIIDIVKPDDFYKNSHNLIYQAMLDLFDRHDPIDILTVGNRLEEKKQIELIGGRTALVEISNRVATAAHIKNYAEIIQKKATLRRLLKAAAEITELGYDEENELDSIIDIAEQKLFDVSSNFIQKSFVPIRSVLSDAFDRIDELHKQKGKLRGLPTGFIGLDNLLAGLQKSDLIILAARPSVGKTSFALDIVRHIGVRAKKSVGFFSLEMAKEQLVDRLICAEANVDLWKLRTGRLSDKDDDFPRIGEALSALSEAPIYIDDTPAANIMSLRAKTRRLKAEHGLDLIVIDYLQLMEGRTNKSDNRVNEVAEISRGLKQIGRELQVPVLALAQLSRAVEQSKPAIPKLAHLRESGSIEQDADVVMFLYRKAADRNYMPDELTPEEQNSAELHIAKHRNGPTGMVRLIFDKQRASFRNAETRRTEPPPQTPGFNPANVGLPPGIPPKN
ncbi:replicative DNA helicase [Candidatus Parcubacteria bacterium]|nr:MAG: replicative DNA helicase [Candidatus Parcubacteria bacterium]